MREAAFATAADPIDEGGARKLAAFRLPGPPPDQLLTSSATAAEQTAAHIGADATVEPALADIETGGWAGRSVADLLAAEPVAIAAWLADPAAGTPGGETIGHVADRLRPWLDRIAAGGDRVVAVSHAAVLRAAVTIALDVAPRAGMAIDIAPLTAVTLSFNRGWRLQGIRPA